MLVMVRGAAVCPSRQLTSLASARSRVRFARCPHNLPRSSDKAPERLEQIVSLLVWQVVKEILEKIMDIPQERISQRNGERSRCVRAARRGETLEVIIDIAQERNSARTGSRKSMCTCSCLKSWNRSWKLSKCCHKNIFPSAVLSPILLLFADPSIFPQERVSERFCQQTLTAPILTSCRIVYRSAHVISQTLFLRSEFLTSFCEKALNKPGPNCSEASRQFRCFLCRTW